MYCVYGNSSWYINGGPLFGGGPLLGGSVIGGSTVLTFNGYKPCGYHVWAPRNLLNFSTRKPQKSLESDQTLSLLWVGSGYETTYIPTRRSEMHKLHVSSPHCSFGDFQRTITVGEDTVDVIMTISVF